MTNCGRLLTTILSGRSDGNIDFDDLRRLLERMEFVERMRGSHHIFVKEGIRDMINLQSEGSMAKPYQVRQVRTIITANGLAIEEE